jgi:hypothetical protein
MKKTTLFIKFAIVPFISSLLFLINSLINYRFYYGNSIWSILVELYYDLYNGDLYDAYLFGYFIASIILIGLFVSVGFLIKQMIIIFKYSGFPSIKEAKSYYDLANKIKEKRRLEKVNKEYQLKLAKLEEDKKKYL